MLNSTIEPDYQGSPLHEIKQEKNLSNCQYNAINSKLCYRQFICIIMVTILSLIFFVRISIMLWEIQSIETQMTKQMVKIQQIVTNQAINNKDLKLKIENIETQMTKEMIKFQQIETKDIKLKVENIETQITKEMAQFQQIAAKQDIKDIKLKVENIESQMSNIEQKVIQLGILSSTSLPYTQQVFDPNSYKYNISNLQNPNQIVQVIYGPGEFSKMPLNTLQFNNESKKIEDILYSTEDIRNERIQFQQYRKQFIKQRKTYQQYYLTEFNNPLDAETHNRGILQNEKQWLRLQKTYQLSKITKELPFCIMVPGYNNNENFRIEHNLNSIFMQNYTNYKVVIIDDASTDGSLQIYKKYLQFYKIDKKYYTLISHKKKVSAMQSHYFGTLFQCSKDSIVLHVDGDDQLIGRNVFKLFNYVYQTKKSGIVYSNYYHYGPPDQLWGGGTSEYSQNQKKNQLYRSLGAKFSHLRSFRAQLFYQVDPINFQDSNGNFYTSSVDAAIFFPILELSCGRINKIYYQYHYLYNAKTGLNVHLHSPQKQIDNDHQVKKKKKYACWKQFDQRMKK